MLTSLSIHNFGLIDRLSVDLGDGLNVLTGETGAGKSIVIGALRIVLGDRIQASQLRDPNLPCVIEAAFELKSKELQNIEILKEYGTQEDPSTFIIHRTFTPEGRHKIKINGFSVTVSQLKAVGNHLIDFHGPHDHQMLLSSDSHKGLLDRLVDFKDVQAEYKEIFDEYSAALRGLENFQNRSSSRERDLDLISHQIKELGQVKLDKAVYDDILQEQTKVNNAEKLSESAGAVIQCLEGDQNGVGELIRRAFSPMKALNQTDEQTARFTDYLDQLQETNEQLLAELKEYAQGLSYDPKEASEINNQCDIYENIIKKYGPTFEDVNSFYADIREQHDLLNHWEENDRELKAKVGALKSKLKTVAQKITKARQKQAVKLKQTIEQELTELGIAKVKFDVHIEQADYKPDGQDTVSFYISPNAGEDLKPLAQIVSSGEAARVMLALKKALIKADPIPVLIFDEIDAQIGGRLGSVTGQKLRDISKNRQVILITHLPQIASFANSHFKVKKIVKNGRALTTVEVLDKERQVKEIAQMMSGTEESTISVKHAHDMLAKANR